VGVWWESGRRVVVVVIVAVIVAVALISESTLSFRLAVKAFSPTSA